MKQPLLASFLVALAFGCTSLLVTEAPGAGGKLLWEDQVDKGGGFDQALAITAHGNWVFAAGFGQNAAGNSEFLVRAYDTP